jgi:hypothetical protein
MGKDSNEMDSFFFEKKEIMHLASFDKGQGTQKFDLPDIGPPRKR